MHLANLLPIEFDLWRYCQYDHGIGWGTFGSTPTAVTYVASLWGGSIGGIVVGVLVIILVSMPLCCGVLKH